MKFKVGDKVMLKAPPWDNWARTFGAQTFFNSYKNFTLEVLETKNNIAYVLSGYELSFKYLKHAVKPKAVKYTIDCRGMVCYKCPSEINGDVKICEFKGTKSQVEAHIKRYWKQPKLKAVK